MSWNRKSKDNSKNKGKWLCVRCEETQSNYNGGVCEYCECEELENIK